MDVPLDRLAEVSAVLARGEEAAEEGGWTVARDALDEADALLQGLREDYVTLPAAVRPTMAALATPLRQRRDALAGRVPAPRAVSEVPAALAVDDPEQEADPEA